MADQVNPDPAVLARLDELDAACRANPADIDAQIQLWRAVAALDQWVFINRGTSEAPRPYAIASDFGQLLCIYSSADRAQATARSNGFVSGDVRSGGVKGIVLGDTAPPEMMKRIASSTLQSVGVVISTGTISR